MPPLTFEMCSSHFPRISSTVLRCSCDKTKLCTHTFCTLALFCLLTSLSPCPYAVCLESDCNKYVHKMIIYIYIYIYTYIYIYIFIMNVFRSNCEASTRRKRASFLCVCVCDLLCDEHLLCVLGERSRPHNHTVHGRTLPGSPPPLLLRGPPSLRVVRLSESTFLYILHVSI